MSELKKSYTIPSTQARLSPSVDFVGYIYAQFLPISGIDAVNRIATNILTNAMGQGLSNTGVLIGGVTNMSESFSRDIYARRVLGNYEVIQNVPGKITCTLSMDKVIFYNDNNKLDNILDINYNGAIKQSAPLMIVKTMEDAGGNMKTIMFLDCWFKSETITYDLSSKLLTVSKLNMDCARIFAPIDMREEGKSFITNTINNVTGVNVNNIGASFNLNLPI